ncbi:hypothetical protein EDC04DRAFT_2766694, partial [Pisolithus marmoratus]
KRVAPSKAPVVPVNSTKTSPHPANRTKDNLAVVDDELAKRKARAERFGIPLSVKSGSKRAAPAEAVDAEELER